MLSAWECLCSLFVQKLRDETGGGDLIESDWAFHVTGARYLQLLPLQTAFSPRIIQFYHRSDWRPTSPPLPVIMARLWSLWFITNRRRPEIEVSLWRLWHWATSCHSNGNDTTHLRRRTEQSIAFTMWRQCALRFNTRRLCVEFSVFFDGCGVASVVGFGQIWRPRIGR